MTGPDLPNRPLARFGVTMITMGISFALYYLGLFGGCEGPLRPEQLGAYLAQMGIDSTRFLIILGAVAIVAGTWNWIPNLVLSLKGRQSCRPIRKGVLGNTVCLISIVCFGIALHATLST